MEHLRKLEQIYLSGPFNAYFEPEVEVREGEADYRFKICPEYFHAAQAIHGAIYFKALDDVTFLAANSIVTDVFVFTASFQIEFLRPVAVGDIRGVARVTSKEGGHIESTGELFDSDGNLVARGTGIFARTKIPLELGASAV